MNANMFHHYQLKSWQCSGIMLLYFCMVTHLLKKSDFGSTIQTLGIGQGSAGSAFIGLIGEIRLVIGQHRFLLDQYVTDSTPFPES